MNTALKSVTGFLGALVLCAVLFMGGIGPALGIGTTYASWTASASAPIGTIQTGNLALTVDPVNWDPASDFFGGILLEGRTTLRPSLIGPGLTAQLRLFYDGGYDYQVTTIFNGISTDVFENITSSDPIDLFFIIMVAPEAPINGAFEFHLVLEQTGGGWSDSVTISTAGIDIVPPLNPPYFPECTSWVRWEPIDYPNTNTCIYHTGTDGVTRFFINQYWAQPRYTPGVANEQGNLGPWMEISDALLFDGAPLYIDGEVVRPWNHSWVYGRFGASEIVAHDGMLWRVRWWNRSIPPSLAEPYGPWELIGTLIDTPDGPGLEADSLPGTDFELPPTANDEAMEGGSSDGAGDGSGDSIAESDSVGDAEVADSESESAADSDLIE